MPIRGKERTVAKGLSPLHTYIARTQPGIWFTVSEAADEVGRSATTLTRWRKQGIGPDPKPIKHGSNTVYLYSEDDINALRELADHGPQ